MLAHLARILNILIDSDILFIKKKKNHPLSKALKCVLLIGFLFFMFFFFLVRFFVFLGFSLGLENKFPMLLTAC